VELMGAVHIEPAELASVLEAPDLRARRKAKRKQRREGRRARRRG
jgi:hypothetical protein